MKSVVDHRTGSPSLKRSGDTECFAENPTIVRHANGALNWLSKMFKDQFYIDLTENVFGRLSLVKYALS